jgi:hypothetical protein
MLTAVTGTTDGVDARHCENLINETQKYQNPDNTKKCPGTQLLKPKHVLKPTVKRKIDIKKTKTKYRTETDCTIPPRVKSRQDEEYGSNGK